MLDTLATPPGPERTLALLLTALPDQLAVFERRCAEVTDWPALLAVAGRHGLEGVLSHSLSNLFSGIPPEVREHCAQQEVFQRLAYSRCSAAFEETLQALNSAEIQAVALKGPALGERLYPHPAARPSTDLDFLVAPADLDPAIAAIEALGYRAKTGPSARYYRRHHHHVGLTRAHSPAVELHFRTHRGFGVRIPAAPFLARARPYVTRQGSATWVLAPEDELLYLCLHAAGHCYVRWSWLYEIKLLGNQSPTLDASPVAERARALRAATVLAFTLEVVRRDFGGAWPDPGARTGPDALRWRLATGLLAAINLRQELAQKPKLGRLLRLTFQALLCDHPVLGARLLLHQLLRDARKRAHRALPRITPAGWSA
jgi:hypothetical protein